MKKTFAERIYAISVMYRLPTNAGPTLGTPNLIDRLRTLKAILTDEANGIDEIILAVGSSSDVVLLTMIGDLLAHITVCCHSEALMYGLPMEQILDLVMDSNESKLDENGLPIYDENGKLCEGPNYTPPGPMIQQLIATAIHTGRSTDEQPPPIGVAKPGRFIFNLGDDATIQCSQESGRVVARSECEYAENQYMIRYKTADGRAVAQWWQESALY